MTDPTPGPWSYYHDTCARCEKDGVAEYIIDGPPGGYHGQFSNEADARLIAAAPEMYAILQLVADHFANTDAVVGIAASAVLAKARGETPHD